MISASAVKDAAIGEPPTASFNDGSPNWFHWSDRRFGHRDRHRVTCMGGASDFPVFHSNIVTIDGGEAGVFGRA